MIVGKAGFLGKMTRATERLFSQSTSTCLWCGDLRRYGRRGAKEELDRFLCITCADAVPWITDIRCRICGRHEDCPDCVRRTDGIINRSAAAYDPLMKEWLARYKYRGFERLEPVFGVMIQYAFEKLAEELGREPNKPTVISYVPLSERRLGERGFNQAERMAVYLSKQTKLPLLPLLVRTRHTEKQSYKSRRERLESLNSAFVADEGELAVLRGHFSGEEGVVVLVDDVYTTGSTMNLCADVIREGAYAAGMDRGRVRICGLTWAR